MRIAVIALTLSVLTASQIPALAEKRVALVIGNSAYQNVVALSNPTNDASAMTATLKAAGFDLVDSRRDLKANDMKRALRDFSDTARDADVAVIYYAGHGIEIDGANYLIPIDATLERDIDALDEAVSLDRVLTVMEPAKQLRLVILDACRDNPFNKTMKRTIGTRAISRGLAKVEPTNPNTLIAFAAKAGSTASDGDGKNSPFASSLAKHLTTPGLDLRKAFGFVRDDVLKVTNNKQEPFVYGSLGGNDVALVPAVAVVSAPLTAPTQSAAPPIDANAALRRDYELAERVGTREAWDYFISTYPGSFYAKLAQAQRNKIAAEDARLAATEKAKAAQEDQTRLAIEGAKSAEQTKAAALAKAAEQARVAAELAKQTEEKRLEVERAKAVAQAKSAEDAKTAASEAKSGGPVAALTLDQSALKSDASAVLGNIPKQLQIELRRVGCVLGAINESWNANAQKSMEAFNKNAGMKLDVKIASADSLDAVKSKPGRICPLVCERGYKADSDRCIRIACKTGYEVGEDNICEKTEVRNKKPETPAAKRDVPAASPDKPGQANTVAELTKQFTADPTCSKIRAACDRSLAPGHCAQSFAGCMQTGKWKSGVSYYEGVARR